MKLKPAALALICSIFAASAAVAQSGAPGGAPRKPTRITAVPPPPPPGGPDKYTTQTGPLGPGRGAPASPTPVDDFAPDPNTQPSTCHNTGIQYGQCVASLMLHCVNTGGEISSTDNSFTCTRPGTRN